MTIEQREMIEAAELARLQDEASATETVSWDDYPADPNEEANFHDFEPAYRFVADDEPYPF